MIWYLPLEPYRERYTEQLLGWTERAFQRRGLAYQVVHGQPLGAGIRVGRVLDATGRGHWALTQVAQLVSRLGEVTEDDVVFVEDLFTPGLEALAYAFHQLGRWPRLAARNYAQSVDPDDFTFGMRGWMRPFEQMADQVLDDVFVASTCHREMLQAAGLGTGGPFGSDVHVVGLPFDSGAVRAQGPATRLAWGQRPHVVVYASRLDSEKQPHLFMDIVERSAQSIDFVVCTGADEPRSDDPTAVERLRVLASGSSRVTVLTGLTKPQYYDVLAGARAQLNTARQDFVSFTALEASAFGVPTLAPAFRSFPEALENRRSQLYVPWAVDDAVAQLERLLDYGEPACVRLAAHHDGTFDRTFDALGLEASRG